MAASVGASVVLLKTSPVCPRVFLDETFGSLQGSSNSSPLSCGSPTLIAQGSPHGCSHSPRPAVHLSGSAPPSPTRPRSHSPAFGRQLSATRSPRGSAPPSPRASLIDEVRAQLRDSGAHGGATTPRGPSPVRREPGTHAAQPRAATGQLSPRGFGLGERLGGGPGSRFRPSERKTSENPPQADLQFLLAPASPDSWAAPMVGGSEGDNDNLDSLSREMGPGTEDRPPRPPPIDPLKRILFQGFNWESHNSYPWYDCLGSQAQRLASVGVTDVWMPPPSHSVDRQGYLPSELYNLNASKYGTEEQLRSTIDELHSNGICCHADLVLNHRCASRQDQSGKWNMFDGGRGDGRADWGPWAVVSNDTYDGAGQGNVDSGESYEGAPDIDHTNKRVQKDLCEWLCWLKGDVGFDGWRFDFVKGYSPAHAALYCQHTQPVFAVGELWMKMSYEAGKLSSNQNAHRQALVNWVDSVDGVSAVFDFTTKGILQAAVLGEFWRLRDDGGTPPGMIGWYPKKAVTFIDNHDTGSTQRHWPFPEQHIAVGYAYILTHPGTPCIFYDHFVDRHLARAIAELAHVRQRNELNVNSHVSIWTAEKDIYVAEIDNRVVVKLGSQYDMGSLLPDPTRWQIACSGNNYAVWELAKAPTTAAFPLPPSPLPSSIPLPELSEEVSTPPLAPEPPTEVLEMLESASKGEEEAPPRKTLRRIRSRASADRETLYKALEELVSLEQLAPKASDGEASSKAPEGTLDVEFANVDPMLKGPEGEFS